MKPTPERPSLRKAINAACRECIYDSQPGNGTWREQTEGCTAPKCTLYPVRPLTEAATEARARLWGKRGQDGPKTLNEGALPASEVSGPSGTVNAACAPACDGIPAIGSDADGQA